MAVRPAGAGDLNQLSTIFRFGVVGHLSDSQLLQSFRTGRNEAGQAAFSAIVERHGPMVLGVCRQVLRNLHDADDAFQATFMVMARKAGTVQNSESLASWLHGIALRVAARAKADEARRRVHERRFAKLRQVECDCESIRSESFPELHQEIARLPQRYREIVVLCYLEGLTSEQAAARIGCPPGTVFSRLSRARVRLRGSLVRRGVALPTESLAVAFTADARGALPPSLLETTVGTSIDFAARRAPELGLASAPAVTLARGVLYAMAVSKLKILGAASVACVLALGGASAAHGAGRRPDETATAGTSGDRRRHRRQGQESPVEGTDGESDHRLCQG